MKKNILIAILLPLLLASCSIDWNGAKDQKISELEQQVTELKHNTSTGMILFEKRTRCAALSSEIGAKIDTMNKEYADLGKFSIGEVFYSPIKDVCLWVRLTGTYAKDGSPMERRALYEFGKDFGAAEPIIGCEKILTDKQGANTCTDWDNGLKKLK